MVFMDLPLTQEFKTLGMDDYLWVQALFNHEELERLRGQEPNDPHQRFLWRIIRMGVIDPEAADKAMDLYQVHEAFFSNRNEAVEDVEGGQRSNEFILVFFLVTHLLTSS